MLRGGCYCGAVQYQTAARPQRRTACHCTICRGTSGAPFVAWFSVPAGSFRFVAGEPARFRSSERATRTFCAACGTPLTFQSAHSDKIDVTACSLEDPEQAPPADHTYGRSQLSWVKIGDALPGYPEARPK